MGAKASTLDPACHISVARHGAAGQDDAAPCKPHDTTALRIPRLAARHRDLRAAVLPHRHVVRRLGLAHHERRDHPGPAAAHGHRTSPAHAAAVRDRGRRAVVRATPAQRRRSCCGERTLRLLAARRDRHAARSFRRRSISSASSTATGMAAISTFLTQRVFRFEPYPEGDFSWHHLWFIIYLYVYVLLLLPLLLWWRRAKTALTPGRLDLRARAAARDQRGAAQAALPRDSQPHERLVHLRSLSAADDPMASCSRRWTAPGTGCATGGARRWRAAIGLHRRSDCRCSKRRRRARYRVRFRLRESLHLGVAHDFPRVRPAAS